MTTENPFRTRQPARTLRVTRDADGIPTSVIPTLPAPTPRAPIPEQSLRSITRRPAMTVDELRVVAPSVDMGHAPARSLTGRLVRATRAALVAFRAAWEG